jgi:hypothetical protein
METQKDKNIKITLYDAINWRKDDGEYHNDTY